MKVRNLLTVAALSLLVCACTKNIKEDIDELKKPVPSGVSLLTETATVAADGTFGVLFRVNPSDYTPTKEDVDLLFSSASSFDLDSPAPDGKCSIISLEAYQNESLTDVGAWKAVFKANNAESFNGTVVMRLSITYTRSDSKDRVSIFAEHTLDVSKYAFPSSATLTSSQPVSQTAQSITDGQWLPAYAIISSLTPTDASPAYDLSLIDYVKVTMTGAMADCIEPVIDPADRLKIQFRPIPEKFASLGIQNAFISAIAEAEVMDKLNRSYTQKIRVRFYPNKVIIPAPAELIFPKSALDDELVTIELDYAEALGKIGITEQFVKQVKEGPNKNLTVVSSFCRQEPELVPGQETYVSPSIDASVLDNLAGTKVTYLINKSPDITPGSYYGVIHFKIRTDDNMMIDAEIWQEVKFAE